MADYEGHKSFLYGHGMSLFITAIVLCPIGFILTIWRMVSKQIYNVKIPWVPADYALVLAVLFNIGLNLVGCIGVEYGGGKHSWEVNAHDKMIGSQLGYAGQIFYKLTINLVKLSFLLIYRNFFWGRPFKIIDNILIAWVSLYMVGSILVSIFECNPVRYAWDKSIHGKCLDLTIFFRVNAIQNIITDILIFLIPIPYIWKLPAVSARQKAGMSVAFAAGFVTCIVSILRYTTLKHHADSYDGLISSIYNSVEPCTAIIACTIPTLKAAIEDLPGVIKRWCTPKSRREPPDAEKVRKGQEFLKPDNGLSSKHSSYGKLADDKDGKDGFRERLTNKDDIEMGPIGKTKSGNTRIGAAS
ncbi:uncharacterized protein KY384_004737 [Bacidia gigantensis]|uniref:uncharacterized protein n=1 Tax=Bacidia gigantensis TaxID=2732470 RepID=UPI001D05681F|nr:uncharacterized protein KY384_004737 [Bacidia gigantensis]KAG8530237.1 hypothetical protein KY384_004737 [Bacidia gigantensis]